MDGRLEYLGRNRLDRPIFLVGLDDWSTFPARLELPSKLFGMLTAGDSSSAAAEVLTEFARSALTLGCVYLSAWGRGCERLHDVFDEVLTTSADGHRPGVLTTWHQGDSLAQAVEFATIYAAPDNAYLTDARSVLVVAVGDARLCDDVKTIVARLA